ncbi:MAG: hypothetical protein WCO10_01785 [bacterium]
MKKLLTVKILSLIILSVVFILPQFTVLALNYVPLEKNAFPGVTFNEGTKLNTFLSQSFQFGLALAAILAVVMIIWGGVETMLSESVFSKDSGKTKIKDALYGLGLALVSWLILYTINPEILNFKLTQ